MSVNQDLLFLRLEHANKNRVSKFNMVKSVSKSQTISYLSSMATLNLSDNLLLGKRINHF